MRRRVSGGQVGLRLHRSSELLVLETHQTRCAAADKLLRAATRVIRLRNRQKITERLLGTVPMLKAWVELKPSA